jgi:hypothetical protein
MLVHVFELGNLVLAGYAGGVLRLVLIVRLAQM